MKRLQLVIFILLQTTALHAHGVGYSMVEGDALSFRCAYSTGEAMSYAKALVYSPDNAEIEYANGRTDRNGVFSFVPDVPGLWRIVVDDGMGHRLVIETDESGCPPADSGSSPLSVSGVVLGISLIMNISGIGYVLANRKST